MLAVGTACGQTSVLMNTGIASDSSCNRHFLVIIECAQQHTVVWPQVLSLRQAALCDLDIWF